MKGGANIRVIQALCESSPILHRGDGVTFTVAEAELVNDRKVYSLK